MLAAVAEQLRTCFPDATARAANLIEQLHRGPVELPDDEREWAAVAYGVLRQFAGEQDSRAVARYVPMQSGSKYNEFLEAFNALYFDPFYEYVDERLDDPRFVLSQLIRFKHLCEWFRRAELFQLWSNDTRRGEKLLGMKLYEFLFTEGIRIHIEPWSISGEADMVSSQEGPERLVAEAKIFNTERSKGADYIVQGFRQIYQYTLDHNEPTGYLVIFNTGNKQLRFAVSGAGEPVPYIIVSHKTIFFLVIDIFPYDTTASERPKPEIAEITEAQIVASATA